MDNDINKITDRLFLSNYETSLNYKLLKSLGIKQILSVGIELPPHKTQYFKTMHLNVEDNEQEDIIRFFISAFHFINNDVTLVHCYAGISRSATIVISYLMRSNKISYIDAYNLVLKERPIISPNVGFMKQLYRYGKLLKKIST
jgi:protein-tyrosine phosphatase